MATGRTLREKKRDQVRTHLEDTAAELFKAKGFDETTVAEIAAAAEVSPRTFFRYFPTKEDVIFGEAASALADLRSYVRQAPKGASDYEALKRALIEFGQLLQGQKSRTLTAIQLMATSPALAAKRGDVIGKWLQELAQELSERPGRSRSRLRTRLLVSTAFGAFLAGIDEWRLEGGKRSLPLLLQRSFDSLEQEVLQERP
jgi:AcrR family transcriptional regulator